MAVSEEITLPSQPALGENVYTPLGGDGWSAPHSVWEVAMSLAGDGSGGNNTLQVNFDPRWQAIVSYVRIANSGASTTIEMMATLLPDPPRSTPQAQAFSNATPVNTLAGGFNVFTWCPPPLPHFRILKTVVPNTTGDTHTLMFYLYNFQKRVTEKVPLNIILASLPRAESMFPTTDS